MKAHEAVIAWTPSRKHDGEAKDHDRAGEVRVEPLLSEDDPHDWTDEFDHVSGAADVERRGWRGVGSVLRLMLDFHTLVTRDGVGPMAAHREFLKIDEYASHVAPDLPGVEERLRDLSEANGRETVRQLEQRQQRLQRQPSWLTQRP
jgi:hypothetical protein